MGGQFLSSGPISVLFPGSQAPAFLLQSCKQPSLPSLWTSLSTWCVRCTSQVLVDTRHQVLVDTPHPPAKFTSFFGGWGAGSEENMNRRMQRLYKAARAWCQMVTQGLGEDWLRKA